MILRRLTVPIVFVSSALLVTALRFDANAETKCAGEVGPETALSVGIAAIYKMQLYATYQGKGNIKKLEPIVSQGIPDFLARNTGCCTFTPLGQDDFAPTPEWSERNSFYGFVRATFAAHWNEDADGRKAVDVTRIVAVTTCGEAIWYDVDDDDW